MDDLQEQLACPWVQNEDCSINGLCCQISLKGLVNGHSIYIGVIHKPDDLIGKELSIVLTAQVRLCWFRGIKLQALSDTLS